MPKQPDGVPRQESFSTIERTYLAADTGRMARKPEPAQPIRWDIYRVVSKGKLLGTIEAGNAGEAVKKAAEEFKTDAWRLIAVQRK
jgi:hypothetical protein